ncbi:pyrimidin 4 [Perilla frutescens var. hirtella]|nr:pyrimidin 4 [Perilla frutescens var. hirtella]
MLKTPSSTLVPCRSPSVPVKARRSIHLKVSGIKMELSITQPDDWHLHLRDGELLEAVVPHSSQYFGRAIVMPNLRPPITTTTAAMSYRKSILKALPENSNFTPLMTLYLTDTTSPNEIKLARESGIVFAVKLYPAGATTNSQDGVTDLFGKCLPVLEEMAQQNMPLLVHGEVTSPDVDVFDREKVFIDTILNPLIQKLPRLKVVMEHITTKDAVDFVLSCDERFVAATVTPQHLVLNRNALFQGGLQPHNYCLPVLKREIHRQAIVSAVTSGSKRFFLGTDSAPHERNKKECSCGCAGIYNSPVALSVYAKVFEEAGALDKLEAFTSYNGPDFYGLPRNNSKIKLIFISFVTDDKVVTEVANEEKDVCCWFASGSLARGLALFGSLDASERGGDSCELVPFLLVLVASRIDDHGKEFTWNPEIEMLVRNLWDKKAIVHYKDLIHKFKFKRQKTQLHLSGGMTSLVGIFGNKKMLKKSMFRRTKINLASATYLVCLSTGDQDVPRNMLLHWWLILN